MRSGIRAGGGQERAHGTQNTGWTQWQEACWRKLSPADWLREDALPAEADIAAEYQISRLTVREARLTICGPLKVISVQRGRGTFITAPDEWTSVEAIVRAAAYSTGNSMASRQLLEARRFVESGAAALAAARRTESDVELLRGQLDAMAAADAAGDADAFVEADRLFHTLILKMSGQHALFAAVFVPMGRVLADARREAFVASPVRARHVGHSHRKVARRRRTRRPARCPPEPWRTMWSRSKAISTAMHEAQPAGISRCATARQDAQQPGEAQQTGGGQLTGGGRATDAIV